MHSVHDTYPMAHQSCGEKLGKPDNTSSGKLKKFSSTPAASEMQHSAKRKHPTSPGRPFQTSPKAQMERS
eukprot:5812455-Amphidinium_carterae.2